MKKVTLIVALMLSLITANAFGASVNLDGLTEKQKAEIMLQAAKMKEHREGGAEGLVNTLSKVQGIGKETGVAIREGLTAVVDVADKFSDTSVGKITIALIVWRVAGSQIMLIVMAFVGIYIGWKVFAKLSLTPRIPVTWAERSYLWGLIKTPKPIEWKDGDKESEEMRAIGVVSLLAGVVIFVVAIANI